MSKAHIIVGATETGKTTFVKSLLAKVPNKKALFVWDVNNEYKNLFPYEFLEIETFMDKAVCLEKSVIVIEEATISFNNRSCDENLQDILVRKRHTKNHVILVFHSMRSVPRYIYELSNYITIFKTNDSPDMTARELKDDRLAAIMTKIKNSPDKHVHETLKIY
jgi:hypothetical protein